MFAMLNSTALCPVTWTVSRLIHRQTEIEYVDQCVGGALAVLRTVFEELYFGDFRGSRFRSHSCS